MLCSLSVDDSQGGRIVWSGVVLGEGWEARDGIGPAGRDCFAVVMRVLIIVLCLILACLT